MSTSNETDPRGRWPAARRAAAGRRCRTRAARRRSRRPRWRSRRGAFRDSRIAAVAPQPDPDRVERRHAGIGDRHRLPAGPAQPAVRARERHVVRRRRRVRLAGARGRRGAAQQRRDQHGGDRDAHRSSALDDQDDQRARPWTPSTRSSSMSEVALGPETKVSGAASPRRRSAATASGTDVVRPAPPATTQMWRSGTSVSARAAALSAVEHDRAGLRDRDRAAGQHAVESVELARRQRRVVDHQLDPGSSRAGRRAASRADAVPPQAVAIAASSSSAPIRRTVAGTRPRARRSGRPTAASPGPARAGSAVVAAGPPRRRRPARAPRGCGRARRRARSRRPVRAAGGVGDPPRRTVWRAPRAPTSRGRSARGPAAGRASPSSRRAGPAAAPSGPLPTRASRCARS